MAMNRHSSNKVKMLKIDASAMKQTRKLSASERSSVASIKFGKPSVATPISERLRVLVVFSLAAARFLNSEPVKENGVRLITNSRKLKPTMNAVASHGPTYGETVPTRASDSPSNDI